MRRALGRVLRARLQPPLRAALPLRALCTSTPSLGRQPLTVPTSSSAPPPGPETDAGPPALEFEPLERSVKGDNRGLLLFSLPIPPTQWTSHLDLMSPLLGAAARALKAERIGVNAYWDGKGDAGPPRPREEEVYPATLVYPDGKRFTFPAFSAQTLTDPALATALAYNPAMDISLAPPNFLPQARGPKEFPEILVCTHGSRDCRCGTKGGELVARLREIVGEHKLNIPIREVAHVGGHKWAANALLVPSLDMLSNLTAADAHDLVEHVSNRRPTYSPMWRHWRGRLGMDAGAQSRIWANILRHLPPSTVFEGATVGVVADERDAVRVPLTFRTYDGATRAVQARIGDTLLQVGKEFDLPSLEGTCGGNLECATCHLYIDPGAPIGQPEDDELDMLGTAISYKDGPSRLGCQIKVTPELSLWAEQGGVIDLPRW